MASRTYYDILGVKRTATTAEIQTAFRWLAMQWHPDRNKRPDATGRFREINDAYQCLKDPQARGAYDWELTKQRERHASQRRSHAQAREHDLTWADLVAAFVVEPRQLFGFFASVERWLARAYARPHGR